MSIYELEELPTVLDADKARNQTFQLCDLKMSEILV